MTSWVPILSTSNNNSYRSNSSFIDTWYGMMPRVAIDHQDDITFFAGNPYKPSFATVGGVDPSNKYIFLWVILRKLFATGVLHSKRWNATHRFSLPSLPRKTTTTSNIIPDPQKKKHEQKKHVLSYPSVVTPKKYCFARQLDSWNLQLEHSSSGRVTSAMNTHPLRH